MVAGCPDTDATAPAIDAVEPEGDAASTSFRLKVSGRGFGLKSVQFDVSKREGRVETEEMALQIERGGAVIKRIDQIDIESPRVLYAEVALSDPLRTGNYDVALIGAEVGGKATVVIARADDTPLHAGNLLRAVLTEFGGGGGGRPEFAQGGGVSPKQLPALLESAARRARAELGG